MSRKTGVTTPRKRTWLGLGRILDSEDVNCHRGLFRWDDASAVLREPYPGVFHLSSLGLAAQLPDYLGDLGKAGGTPDIFENLSFESANREDCEGDACGASGDSTGLKGYSAGLSGNTVRLWDAETGAQRAVVEGHSCCFSPDGKTVASASYDNTVRLWDAATGRPIAAYTCIGDASCCAFSPLHNTIASGDKGGNIYILELIGFDTAL